MGKVGEYRPSLETAARQWPTATATEATGGEDLRDRTNGVRLATAALQWANGLQDLATPPPGAPSSSSGQTSRRLNPAFVEWLMGWPEGWSSCGLTGSDFWATESSPPKPPRRLSSSRRSSDET